MVMPKAPVKDTNSVKFKMSIFFRQTISLEADESKRLYQHLHYLDLMANTLSYDEADTSEVLE